MKVLSRNVINQLIQIEAEIHYGEAPPPEILSFVSIDRESPILLSAPHGAITFRFKDDEIWHEEDEYTAGMALLLSDIYNTSVIATAWRSENSDPNEHIEKISQYKQEIRRMVNKEKIKWLIDLHGAGKESERLTKSQLVDLGIGSKSDYLPEEVYRKLVILIEKYLGDGVTKRSGKPGFPASGDNRIAAFAHKQLEIYSVQIEMKPSVRVARRRIDASMYSKPLSDGGGPFSATPSEFRGMMQALGDFIEYLKSLKE